MIARVLFILLFSSKLQASTMVDFNELRLKQMAKVMNARDYDQMLVELNQFEVLDRACSKEIEEQKLAVSCFEMSGRLKKKGVAFKVKEHLTSECGAKLNQLSWPELQRIAAKQRFLPQLCRDQLKNRLLVISYKRSGKHFE